MPLSLMRSDAFLSCNTCMAQRTCTCASASSQLSWWLMQRRAGKWVMLFMEVRNLLPMPSVTLPYVSTGCVGTV